MTLVPQQDYCVIRLNTWREEMVLPLKLVGSLHDSL